MKGRLTDRGHRLCERLTQSNHGSWQSRVVNFTLELAAKRGQVLSLGGCDWSPMHNEFTLLDHQALHIANATLFVVIGIRSGRAACDPGPAQRHFYPPLGPRARTYRSTEAARLLIFSG